MELATPVRIAIVDDDESVRESLLGLFESDGYDVSAFNSAEQFLERVHLGQFACLILDVRLPGMSGLDLYSQLRRYQKRVPAVFISAHMDGTVQSRALALGADAFLYKPFKPEVLLGALRTAIANSNV